MPAVTVDDILVLPRVEEPGSVGGTAAADRPVQSVTTAPSGLEEDRNPQASRTASHTPAASAASVRTSSTAGSGTTTPGATVTRPRRTSDVQVAVICALSDLCRF